MIQGAKTCEPTSAAAEYYAYKVAIPFFNDLIQKNIGTVSKKIKKIVKDEDMKQKEKNPSTENIENTSNENTKLNLN